MKGREPPEEKEGLSEVSSLTQRGGNGQNLLHVFALGTLALKTMCVSGGREILDHSQVQRGAFDILDLNPKQS